MELGICDLEFKLMFRFLTTLLIIGITIPASLLSGVDKVEAVATISKSLSRPINNLGLVGWWTMDGPDTLTNIADKSVEGNHGFLVHQGSGTTTTSGPIGQALGTDGSNDYVNAGSAASLDDIQAQGGGGMTVSLWLKVRSYVVVNPHLIAKPDVNTTAGRWGIRIESGTARFRFFKDFNGATDMTIASANNTFTVSESNKWHHMVLTWASTTDASASGQFYLNNVALAMSNTNATANSGPVSDASTNLGIINASGTTVAPLDGYLDDVRLYNRVLSTAEITRLYQIGATSKVAKTLPGRDSLTSGLVGWWTFDGPDTLTNIADKSGQGNNGSLSHAGSGTTTAPGPIGQALSFDGTNDFASTTNTNFPDTSSSDYTVAVWVKPSSIPGGSNPRIFVYATDATNGIKLAFGGANCTANFIFEPKKAGINYGGCGTTTTFSVNTWYHLVGVFKSSTNTVTFYVNNAVQTTSAFAGGLPSTTGVGYIGVSNAASFFPGSLDDLRLYNRALSAAEVLQLYNLGR